MSSSTSSAAETFQQGRWSRRCLNYILGLSQLEVLRLGGNRLTGQQPLTSLHSLHSLLQLELSANDFRQEVEMQKRSFPQVFRNYKTAVLKFEESILHVLVYFLLLLAMPFHCTTCMCRYSACSSILCTTSYV